MIEYVDAQKCYMTFCLNAAPISSRVRFFQKIKKINAKMKKIKIKLKIFFQKWQNYRVFSKKYREKCQNDKITEFCQKNTEKSAKIQKIQRKCKNTEQILKYRVIKISDQAHYNVLYHT